MALQALNNIHYRVWAIFTFDDEIFVLETMMPNLALDFFLDRTCLYLCYDCRFG